MHPNSLVSIDEACLLLGISRPTFNKKRKEYALSEWRVQRNLKFSKAELLEKIYSLEPMSRSVDLSMMAQGQVSDLLIDLNTFDFRRINLFDSFGILSLLVTIRNLAQEGEYVYILLPRDAYVTTHFVQIGFFKELRRLFKTQVGWNEDLISECEKKPSYGLASIQYVAFKGQEQSALESIRPLLVEHGFSEDISSYITWILGELADNSHTHAKGPCYFSIDRFYGETKYLEVSIVDSGVGIEKSLKSNSKYQSLSDSKALLSAFKSRVSSWPDEAERGKGLSDVLKVAIGNQGFLRVESNEQSLFMNFAKLKTDIDFWQPLTSTHGTRYSIVFIDSSFDTPTRDVADKIVEKKLEEVI